MGKKLNYLIRVIILLVILEAFLRFYFGFCDTVLMQNDLNYEYIAQPNQNRFRFRNHIKYNALSMRSEQIDTAAVSILGFGDSVVNGGVQTDHDSLATTILSDSLSKYKGNRVQFLNISAGSWGPDNCFAYLKKFGNFKARQIFLFVSSHDAYDNMTFDNIIDVNASFPSKQATSAIYELFNRYLIPRLTDKFKKTTPTKTEETLVINKRTGSSSFNSGFSSFLSYVRANKISLTIYLHAEQNELKTRTYNEHGQKIIQFAIANNIPIIKDLDSGLSISDFRDDIHINPMGQKRMANIVLQYLRMHKSL